MSTATDDRHPAGRSRRLAGLRHAPPGLARLRLVCLPYAGAVLGAYRPVVGAAR